MMWIVVPLSIIGIMAKRSPEESKLGWPPRYFNRMFHTILASIGTSFCLWITTSGDVPVLYDLPAHLRQWAAILTGG